MPYVKAALTRHAVISPANLPLGALARKSSHKQSLPVGHTSQRKKSGLASAQKTNHELWKSALGFEGQAYLCLGESFWNKREGASFCAREIRPDTRNACRDCQKWSIVCVREICLEISKRFQSVQLQWAMTVLNLASGERSYCIFGLGRCRVR